VIGGNPPSSHRLIFANFSNLKSSFLTSKSYFYTAKYIGPQSHHDGIEILAYEDTTDVLDLPQSHHDGIEIYFHGSGRLQASYPQSHHDGIEMRVTIAVRD